IVARGIDVEELGHVVNFDVPEMPDDYIHRVGRTARAEATGDAFTFVAPDEEQDLSNIERAIGRRLPRVTVPGFDYTKKPAERFEIPIAERIAAIRARKAEERKRAKEKAERRAHGGESTRTAPSGGGGRRGSSGPARPRSGAPAGGASSSGDAPGVVRGAWTPARSAEPRSGGGPSRGPRPAGAGGGDSARRGPRGGGGRGGGGGGRSGGGNGSRGA
ncbi:MAG: hypothetical protein LC659_15830, partial [Myxococcales bacterium]|nr:hypothetical protein [Myxococcales bacterium]